MKGFSLAHAFLLVVALLALPAQVHGQTEDPSALVSAWVAALNARNYDAALSLTAEDAFLIYVTTPEGNATTYEGQAQISQALQGYGSDNIHIELIGRPHIENGTLIWTEQLSS